MSDPDQPFFEERFPDDEDDEDGMAWVGITERGLEEVASWCRFNLELGRNFPDQFKRTNGTVNEDFQIALLVWFLLREAYENRGLVMKGVDPGALFPQEWEEGTDGNPPLFEN